MYWGKKGLDEGDHSRERASTRVRCRVVRPDSTFLGVDQPGLAKEAEVVTDGGLILLKVRGYVTDIQGSIQLHQELQHPEPRRITHCFQQFSRRRRLTIAEM